MNKIPHYICIALLTSALLLFTALPAAADQMATTDEVDALVEGFEEGEPTVTAQDQPPNQSKDDLDSVMSGFDDETAEYPPSSETDKAESDSAVSLDGYLKLATAWNFSHDTPKDNETDWRGQSKLRSEAQLDAQARLWAGWRLLIGGKIFYDAIYGLRGRDGYTQEVLDEYEWESEGREVYLQGRLAPFLDLKLGRQIVVWGRSDNLRITDVLNPLDLREPGLTDIEDLRLPSAMTRLDGYWGPWNLSGIAIHEIRFDKRPVFGSDFFPGQTRLPPEHQPSDSVKNTEWAVALNGIFSSKDISIYYANIYDDRAHLDRRSDGQFSLRHARVEMWGTAANLAMGNWLLKSEAAYWRGLKFFNTAAVAYDRIDALVGTEYSGWDDTTASFEWAVRHLQDFDPALKSPPDYAQEDEITNALRLTRTFQNETVELTLLGLIYGPLGQDGSLIRTSVAYDWNDAVNVLLGMVLYESGDRYLFRQIGDNDRFFAEIKYSF